MKRLLIPLLLGCALLLCRPHGPVDPQPDRDVAALHDGGGHAPILQLAPAPVIGQTAELELVMWGWPSSDAPGALLAAAIEPAETEPVDPPIVDCRAPTYRTDDHRARPISAEAWPEPPALAGGDSMG